MSIMSSMFLSTADDRFFRQLEGFLNGMMHLDEKDQAEEIQKSFNPYNDDSAQKQNDWNTGFNLAMDEDAAIFVRSFIKVVKENLAQLTSFKKENETLLNQIEVLEKTIHRQTGKITPGFASQLDKIKQKHSAKEESELDKLKGSVNLF